MMQHVLAIACLFLLTWLPNYPALAKTLSSDFHLETRSHQTITLDPAITASFKHPNSKSSSSEFLPSVDWGYSGPKAPQYWSRLNPKYQLCEVGTMQSPINLAQSDFKPQEHISLHYQPTTFAIDNTGHSIQINNLKNNALKIHSETYDLKQFHFHTPSEHKINQRGYDMEIHFVHENNDGKIVVLSSMVTMGAPHKSIHKMWQQLTKLGENYQNEVVVNPQELLPESMTAAIYLGSLTTPPCRENIQWIILSEPITFSQSQVEFFQSFYSHNARPLQR